MVRCRGLTRYYFAVWKLSGRLTLQTAFLSGVKQKSPVGFLSALTGISYVHTPAKVTNKYRTSSKRV